MTKPIDEWYKNAYNRLYGFLRQKHPEILKEYRQLMKQAKETADALLYLALKEEKEAKT